LLFVDGNPAGIKCVMQGLGRIENVLRLPLTPVSGATEAKIRAAVSKLEEKMGE
jgi:4-hydroxy-tetrahydrodipicolinate synthase